MNEQEVKEWITKYQNGTASARERGLLESWYQEHGKGNSKLSSFPDDIWARQDQSFKKIQDQAGLELMQKPLKLWPRIAVAIAAAVAAITVGVWMWNSESGVLKQAQDDVLVMNNIAPGKNTATLTLANGEVISLSDAKTGVVIGEDQLAYNDGSEVAASRNAPKNDVGGRYDKAQMLMASTPRGGTYQVVLPDGTKVWLNADSKISFPSQFSVKERKVLTDGEVYFEVAKNKSKPFIVESKGQEVTVLGTHFNINAYPNEGSTKTTLLEGSVSVSSLRGRTEESDAATILKPNQQSILKGNAITIQTVNAADAIAWKNGLFVFNEADLETVMRQMGRWYNIEVLYEGEVPKKVLSGKIYRNENGSQMLKLLSFYGIRYKLENQKIIILEATN